MLSHVTIWFSDCEKVSPVPRNLTLKKITTDSWRISLSRHEGWAEAFCIVVDAADQYCITDLREVSSFQPWVFVRAVTEFS